MKTLKVGFFALLGLIVGISGAQYAYAQQAKTLKIGAVFALTGPAAPGIKECMEGVQGAADWVNAKGGITIKGQSYQIKVVPEDNKSAPEGIVAATNKLVHQDKVSLSWVRWCPAYRLR